VPPECISPLEWVCSRELRQEFNILSPYVFASDKPGTVLRGYHAVKLAIAKCNNLVAPELLIATNLRKDMADTWPKEDRHEPSPQPSRPYLWRPSWFLQALWPHFRAPRYSQASYSTGPEQDRRVQTLYSMLLYFSWLLQFFVLMPA